MDHFRESLASCFLVFTVCLPLPPDHAILTRQVAINALAAGIVCCQKRMRPSCHIFAFSLSKLKIKSAFHAHQSCDEECTKYDSLSKTNKFQVHSASMAEQTFSSIVTTLLIFHTAWLHASQTTLSATCRQAPFDPRSKRSIFVMLFYRWNIPRLAFSSVPYSFRQ